MGFKHLPSTGSIKGNDQSPAPAPVSRAASCKPWKQDRQLPFFNFMLLALFW